MKKGTKKPLKKKPSKSKKKSVDLYDADHPLRRTAIEIIENIIEPLIQRGINGERYYKLEDDLTLTMNKRLLRFLKKPITADIQKQNKITLNKNRNPDCDFDPFGADFGIDDSEDDDFDSDEDDEVDWEEELT
jgi:hypothetical protein